MTFIERLEVSTIPPVKSNRIRKSIGKEKTYGKILRAKEDIKKELTLLSERVALNLHQQEKTGKIVILKIRYEDFSTLTKRKSLAQKTQDASQISQIALQLYERVKRERKRCPPVKKGDYRDWI